MCTMTSLTIRRTCIPERNSQMLHCSSQMSKNKRNWRLMEEHHRLIATVKMKNYLKESSRKPSRLLETRMWMNESLWRKWNEFRGRKKFWNSLCSLQRASDCGQIIAKSQTNCESSPNTCDCSKHQSWGNYCNLRYWQTHETKIKLELSD